MRIALIGAAVLAAAALSGLVAPSRAAATQCVEARQIAASAAVNFVGHVVTVERGGRRAAVVVESVAAGRDLPRGGRVAVVDTSPPRATMDAALQVGARYRFLPARGGRPFEVNGCSARRLGGFVLPPATVRETVPGWVYPALALVFVLGCAVGGSIVRRR